MDRQEFHKSNIMNILVSILEIIFPKKKQAAIRIQQNINALNMIVADQDMSYKGAAREKIKQIEQDLAIIRRWPPKT